MSDGEAGPSLVAAAAILAGGFLVCFLVAGAISAMATLLRMQRDGLLSDEAGRRPPIRLLRSPRSMLVTLSVLFVAAVSGAAAVLPTIVASAGLTPGFLGWLSLWLSFLILLLVGTLAFKALALSRPLGYARTIVHVTWIAHFLLRPLTLAVEALAGRLAPSSLVLDVPLPLSGGELRDILGDADSSELLEDQERDWVRSIFDLRDTEIREIMVPRIDMVGLEVETPFEEAIALAADATFTRLPVWQENQDRILGILHVRDLLAALAKGQRPTVRGLLRPVQFVPESKRIDEALRELQSSRVHLAVVVDEYGGTAGIVSLEDILEEIVGEIRDEFDEEGELIRLVDARQAVIDPRVDLDDLNETLALQLPADESDTLAGLLYSLCGRVPARGDEVEFEGLRFTIDRVERQRIRQVTLQSPHDLPAATDGESRAETSTER